MEEVAFELVLKDGSWKKSKGGHFSLGVGHLAWE